MSTHPQHGAVFRVLHTADWHLGKTLCDQDRLAEHEHFLAFLLRTIEHERIDALIVSGDVFDSANPPQAAEKLYFNFIAQLHGLGHCAMIVTAGNHDSPTHLEAPRRLLQALNVHVAGLACEQHAEAFVLLPNPAAPRLVVAAVPFLRDRDLRQGVLGQTSEQIQRDLHTGLRTRYHGLAEHAREWHAAGVPVIATGHLTVLGAIACESERPIHVGGLGAIGVDLFPDLFCYSALGHLHRPQAAGGCAHVRYSGSPIALSFSEAEDLKEVRLLEFLDGRLVENAPISLTAPRRLLRTRISRLELEPYLRSLDTGGFGNAWLELEVSGAVPGENLYELVQELMLGRPERVLRVISARDESLPVRLSEDAIADAEASGALLSDPARVFARKLEASPHLTGEDRASLQTAFAELQELLAERERGQLTAIEPAEVLA